MKQYVITIAKCLIGFAVTLGVCFGLMCAAAAVPSDKIQHNLIESSDKFNKRMPHEMTVKGMYNSMCDNYADAVLFGVAANISPKDIPTSVIDTKYYDDGYGPAEGIRATLGNYPANVDCTRYWHGSLVLIRPLLSVMDIDGIRTVFTVIILLLFALDLVLLFLKGHRAAGVILLVSAVLTQFFFTFSTLEYMTVYIIMFAAIPLYMHFSENDTALIVLSAITATVTAFADFLTTETMTLFIPLLIVFFIRAEKGEKADNKKSILLTAFCSASWLCAYALTFITKWLAAKAVTGKSISETALSAAGERVGELPDGVGSRAELFFGSIGANLSMLVPSENKINVIGIVVWLILFTLVCVFLGARDNRERCLSLVTMVFIAAVPVVRFMVLMNHSYLHNYFTYRALMSSIMALLGLFWYKVRAVDKRAERKRRKKESVNAKDRV